MIWKPALYGYLSHTRTTTSPTCSRTELRISCLFDRRDMEELPKISSEDRFKATKWLTFSAGIRGTEFRSSIGENQADPRVGVSLRVPRLNWVLRAFMVITISRLRWLRLPAHCCDSPASQDFTFLPSRASGTTSGKRVVIIPIKGWNLQVDNYFQTSARTGFDHNNIGQLQHLSAH